MYIHLCMYVLIYSLYKLQCNRIISIGGVQLKHPASTWIYGFRRTMFGIRSRRCFGFLSHIGSLLTIAHIALVGAVSQWPSQMP